MLKFHEPACHLRAAELRVGKQFPGCNCAALPIKATSDLELGQLQEFWERRARGFTLPVSLNLPDVKPEPHHPLWARDPKPGSSFPREHRNLCPPVQMGMKGVKVGCLQISNKLPGFSPNFSPFLLIQPQTVPVTLSQGACKLWKVHREASGHHPLLWTLGSNHSTTTSQHGTPCPPIATLWTLSSGHTSSFLFVLLP